MNWLDLLKSQIEGIDPAEFEPSAYLNEVGGFVEALWENCDYVARWVNHRITLLEHPEDRRIVGVQIWGIEQIT